MTPTAPFSMYVIAVYTTPRRLQDPTRLRNFIGSGSHSCHPIAPMTKASLWYSINTHQPMGQPIRCPCPNLAQFLCLSTVHPLLSSRCLANWGLHQNPGISRIRDLTPSRWTVPVIHRVILCMLRRNTPSTTLDEVSRKPSETSRLLPDTPCGWELMLYLMARLVYIFALMTAVQTMSTQVFDCIS
jgi:hypothetical protein